MRGTENPKHEELGYRRFVVTTMPKTRFHSHQGRKRLPSLSEEDAVANAQAIVKEVITRGIFKARKPEGRAGDH